MDTTAEYKKHYRMMAKLCHKAIKNNKQDFDDAMGIASIGFTRACQDWDPNGKAKLSTLIYKYVFQHLMDHYQRKEYDYYNSRSFTTATDVLEKQVVFPDNESAIDKSTYQDSLETTDRIIFIMRDRGYTYDEISRLLNKVPGNNYTLHKVRKKHQDLIKEAHISL